MDEKYLPIIESAIRTRNFQNRDSAVFQIAVCHHPIAKYLQGIFHFEAGNFQLAQRAFADCNTIDAKFYTALCHKAQKNYAKSLECLLSIKIPQKWKNKYNDYPLLNTFFLSDASLIYENIAECYLFLNKIDESQIALNKSFSIFPHISTFKNLLVFKKDVMVDSNHTSNTTYFIESLEAQKKYAVGDVKGIYGMINNKTTAENPHAPWLMADTVRLLTDLYALKEAEIIFNRILTEHPGFLESTEVYSTVLWYKKDVAKLGCLGTQMAANFPHSYSTWIVLGNFFSLNTNVDKSIQCFQRSTLIKPNWYAYTLLGHELSSKQEYIKALEAFQKALQMCPQNFNALFGIGAIQTHQKNHKIAAATFMLALSMNKHNEMLTLLVVKHLNHMKDYESGIKIVLEFFEIHTNNIDSMISKLQNSQLSENKRKLALELIDSLVNTETKDIADQLLKALKSNTVAFHQKEKLIALNKISRDF